MSICSCHIPPILQYLTSLQYSNTSHPSKTKHTPIPATLRAVPHGCCVLHGVGLPRACVRPVRLGGHRFLLRVRTSTPNGHATDGRIVPRWQADVTPPCHHEHHRLLRFRFACHSFFFHRIRLINSLINSRLINALIRLINALINTTPQRTALFMRSALATLGTLIPTLYLFSLLLFLLVRFFLFVGWICCYFQLQTLWTRSVIGSIDKDSVRIRCRNRLLLPTSLDKIEVSFRTSPN